MQCSALIEKLMPGFVIVEMSQLSAAKNGNTILCVAVGYLIKWARKLGVFECIILKSNIYALIAISFKCQVKE